MKILCTICARGGSQGVKNKNIKKLRGKPLIAHSISQAKQTTLFDKIVVSSDSLQIRQTALKWGASDVIERPAEMATSEAPKLPVIQHAVSMTEQKYETEYDYIVDLDATSPLRSAEDILIALKKLMANPEASNLVTACPARRSPYFNMLEMNAEGFVTLAKKGDTVIERRQDTPACYDMNASIYIWRRDALFNQNKVINERTLLYVMPEERSIYIDSLLDWKFVNLLARNRKDLA